MGKKGHTKPSKYRAREAAPEKAFDPKASRFKSIQDAQDAFGGDEDEFHSNRDAMFFENNGGAQDDLDDVSDEDEVFGLNLPSRRAASDEEEEDEVDLDEDDDEEEDQKGAYEEEQEEPEAPRGRFAKVPNPNQDKLYNSDSASDDDDDEDKAAGGESESEEEESWGAGAYHASRKAPGEPDSDDDEALELEEEEARRIQKKLKGAFAGAEDFGLGGEGDEEMEGLLGEKRGRLEDEEGEEVSSVKKGTKKKSGEKVEVPEGEVSEEAAVAYLLKHQPETLALLDDFAEAGARLKDVEKNLDVVRKGGEDGKEHPALVILELEHQALATYLPTLAFYFSLMLSASPSQPLVDKVLARLSALRTALATMEELDLTSGNLEDYDDEEEEEGSESLEGSEEEEEEMDEEEMMLDASQVWDLAGDDNGDSEHDESELEDESENDLSPVEYFGEEEEADEDDDSEEEEGALGGLDDDELEAIMSSMAPNATADDLMAKVREAQQAKFGGEYNMDDFDMDGLSEDEGEEEEFAAAKVGEKRKRSSASSGDAATSAPVAPKKEKRNKKRKGAAAAAAVAIPELAPLAVPAKSNKKATSTSASAAAAHDDYLENTALSSADATDKQSKRHTLRFHVSQVHQKQMRRESGGKNRVGGDEDLPFRSKERSRREVLKRQEHGGAAGEALDGEEWGDEDRSAAKDVKEDYYELVKSEQQDKKREKKAAYDSQRASEKAELEAMGDGFADGPRGATRKILANKGLQPKRAKINRNPRVKKRMQYEGAKKKVASMKSVYKGGLASLGTNDYGGEKSGIGSKLVKSVRLG